MFSKPINMDGAISQRVEIDMYPIRAMLIYTLAADITKDIYYSDRNFYIQHIKYNQCFQKIIKALNNKEQKNKLCMSKRLNNKKGTIVLILFILEEFYFAWTSQIDKFRLEDVDKQIEVFIKYLKHSENIDIIEYSEYIPMMMREKPMPSIAFQLVYILNLILPYTPQFNQIVTTHVDHLLTEYVKHGTIEHIMPFDEEYFTLCLANTSQTFLVDKEYDSQTINKLNGFQLGVVKYSTMITYAWVVYNPFVLKPYNETLVKMYVSSQYEIAMEQDKKKRMRLYKQKYRVASASNDDKFVTLAKYIQENKLYEKK